MASFSIRKLEVGTDEDLLEAFKNIHIDDVYKDYHKDCYRVYYKENDCLSLKFPVMKITAEPNDGDKYIYAHVDESAKNVESAVNVFDALDNYLTSKMPDAFISKVQPTFKNINKGLVKLYIPYKGGSINSKRLKVFDGNKNLTDFSSVKENTTVKVLAYLKQYKRYRDEIIPMWVLEQIQIVPDSVKEDAKIDKIDKVDKVDKVDNESGKLQEEKSPPDEDLEFIIEEYHKEMEVKEDLLVNEESEEDEIQDNDYETPW
tara:strand:- start:7 stop:786 length:780 start_codon:yes stop_codon:yes gene_type:complete